MGILLLSLFIINVSQHSARLPVYILHYITDNNIIMAVGYACAQAQQREPLR